MLININCMVANCWIIIILCYLTLSAVLKFVEAIGRVNVGFGRDLVLKCFD